MARPWRILDSVDTDAGLLELRQRGASEFLIAIAGRVLMNSAANRSEIALGRLASQELVGRRAARGPRPAARGRAAIASQKRRKGACEKAPQRARGWVGSIGPRPVLRAL